MAQYGFASYRISSTYNTSSVSSEMDQPVSKLFAPFIPNFNNCNGNGTSKGYVTKKKIVPVASKPYYSDEDESDDEWTNHPVRASPPKVDEFHTKVHNEASRPSSGYGDYKSNQPIGGTGTINKHDGYSNNGTNYGRKEVPKPFGDAIKKDYHDDGYYNNGTNGYGGHKPTQSTIRNNKHDGINGYGDYGGRKPSESTIRNNKHDGINGYGDYGGSKPSESTIRNNKYDSPNGYGDYGERRPSESSIRNNKYDSPNGFGDYSRRKPSESTIRNNKYGGPNSYGDYDEHKPVGSTMHGKEGRNPVEIPVVKKDYYDPYGSYGSPLKKDTNYDGHGGYGSPFKDKSYDDHDRYESPFKDKSYDDHGGYRSPFKKDTDFDGYNGSKGYSHGGYGDYNNNKKGHKPPNMYGGYGIGNGHNIEKGKPFGSVSPTRPDDRYYDDDHHDNDYGNKHSGPKITSNWTASPRKGTLSKPTNDIGEAMELLKIEGAKLNGLSRGPKPSYEKRAMDLVNETERLKKIVTGGPQIQSRSTVPIKKDETAPNENFKLTSVRPRFNTVGGRGRERDDVIDHREAQRKYNGIAI